MGQHCQASVASNAGCTGMPSVYSAIHSTRDVCRTLLMVFARFAVGHVRRGGGREYKGGRAALPGQQCQVSTGIAGPAFPGHCMPSQHCWAGPALLAQHGQTCIVRASIAKSALQGKAWPSQHCYASIAPATWPGQHGQASMVGPPLPRRALLASTARPALPGQHC